MNAFETEFLTECETDAAEFAAITKKFPNRAIHFLQTWAEEKGSGPAVDWALSAIKKIETFAAKAREVKEETAPAADISLTVSGPVVAPPAEEKEPVKAAPEFVPIDVEIVDETIPDATPEPDKNHVPGSYHFIRQRLSVTCQTVAKKDLASIVHDATQGRRALPPVFLSGYAGLGKTFCVDLIAGMLPDFKYIKLPPGFTASAFKKALVENCHRPFIFFLDEMHDLDSGIANLLKTLTETNGRIREFNVMVGREEYTITIDPRIHWFIGASNEPIKDAALVGQSGRFRNCQFLPYSKEDMPVLFTMLAEQYLPEANLSSQVKKTLAANCRPFARSMKMMLERMWTEIKEGHELTDTVSTQKALAAAGYYPGGWRKQHIDVLTFLATDEKGRQVQEIAQGPMRGASSKEASELLAELMQGQLIITLGNGRKAATKEAIALLKSLAAPAKKKS